MRSLKKPVVGESIIGVHDLRDRLLGSWKGYQKSVTGSLSTEMQQAYDTNIAQYLHDMSSSDAWKEDAGDLIEQWRRFHSVNFRSFCRKLGIWRTTNKRKSMNWNMSIESILSAELAAAHAAVSSAALEVDGEVEAGFVDFSQKLESLLKEKIYQKLPDKDGLRSDVRNAHSEMRRHVKDVFSQLTRGLDVMYVKSSMSDGEPTSYVSQAMHEGYVKAAAVDRRHFDVAYQEKAREAHRVRVDIIRKQVLGYAGDPTNNKPAVPNVVDAVASLSLADFNVRLCTARTELGNILRKTIDSILSDFDSRYTPRDPPPSEDAHHIEILLRSASEATSKLGKSIRAHLEACQDHEKTAAYAHTLE
ncbi:hypothetical protein TI39_contig380g00022 [Zymoseptoria brevis]|uniref:DUF7605 domain-containing protein n=1 Tax=Zymoseptoria brevis TaxID=1047168 RepID=A0A0F4GP26_9PEZI|nr:hypothetical protein TI39_contig380g00022 [Zymoseptoria brevis]